MRGRMPFPLSVLSTGKKLARCTHLPVLSCFVINIVQGWGEAKHVRCSNTMTRLVTPLNFVKFSADPLRRLLQRIERQRDQWRRRRPAEEAQPQAVATTG